MLEAMRSKAGGWITGLIVALITLAFGLVGIQHYIGAGGAGQVLAKVNSTSITSYQVDQLYNQMRQRMMAQLGANFPSDVNFQKMLKQNALQELINRAVVNEAAIHAGFRVSDEQVISEIQSNPAFQIDGQFSPTRLEQVLRGLGYSQEQFMHEYAQSMIAGQLQTGVQFTSFALPTEIKQALALSEQERSFQYISIPTSQFAKHIKVSDKDAQAYYKENKNKFMDPMKVRIQYIELNLEQFRSKIKPTQEQLKEFYKENARFFSSPRKWHVTHYKVALPANPTHEQIVAARHQLDNAKLGKKEHGLYKLTHNTQWLSMTKDNSELIKRVSELKAGQFSSPFATDNGVQMLKLIAIQEPKTKPFAEAKELVKKQFLKQEVEHAFVEKSDQLSELVYTNPDNLTAAADELNLKVHISDYFTSKGGESALTKNPKVIKAAFADDVLLDGNNSSVIELGTGHLAVLRIKDKIDIKPKPFANVKKAIVDQIKDEKARIKTQALGQEIEKQLKNKQGTKSLFAKHNLKWKHQKAVTRHDSVVDSQILQLAFRTPDSEMVKKPAVSSAQLQNGDYTVVQVLKVQTKPHLSVSEQRRKLIADAIATGFGKLEFDLYIKSMKDAASIQVMKRS